MSKIDRKRKLLKIFICMCKYLRYLLTLKLMLLPGLGLFEKRSTHRSQKQVWMRLETFTFLVRLDNVFLGLNEEIVEN